MIDHLHSKKKLWLSTKTNTFQKGQLFQFPSQFHKYLVSSWKVFGNYSAFSMQIRRDCRSLLAAKVLARFYNIPHNHFHLVTACLPQPLTNQLGNKHFPWLVIRGSLTALGLWLWLKSWFHITFQQPLTTRKPGSIPQFPGWPWYKIRVPVSSIMRLPGHHSPASRPVWLKPKVNMCTGMDLVLDTVGQKSI